MRLNLYVSSTTKKFSLWISIVLSVCVSFFLLILLWAGLLLSIDSNSAIPFLAFFIISLCFFYIICVGRYNEKKSYFEIYQDKIKVVDYPFFKKREREYSLGDIKKIKTRYAGYGPGFLVFKNEIEKKLFKAANIPEIRDCFVKLGFGITFGI